MTNGTGGGRLVFMATIRWFTYLVVLVACAIGATSSAQPSGEPLFALGIQTPQLPNLTQLTPDEQAKADKELLEAIQKEWTPALRKVCEVEGIDAMAFVLVSRVVFSPWEKPYGVPAMRLLARATGTYWSQVDGVQVFSAVGNRRERFGPVLLDALRTMDEAGLERLTSGEATLSDFGPLMDSVVETVAIDPAMVNVLLSRGSGTRVQLQILPKASFIDPKTGERRTVSLAPAEDEPFFTEEKEGEPLYPYVPLQKPRGDGGLDFGEGEVMTLFDFKTKAEQAYKTRYFLDGRIASTLVFARGRMNQETFEKVYLSVGSATPPVRRPDEDIVELEQIKTWLRTHEKALSAFRGADGISAEDSARGASVSASELAAKNPELASRLASKGIPPDATLDLGVELMFIFDPGGFRDVMPPQTTPDGKSYRRTMSNRLKFVVVGS